MARFVVIATVNVVEGRMEELLPLLLAHRDRCLTDEPDTLRFEVLRPKETANQLLIYEEYLDEAAWHTHLHAGSFARVVAETTDMVDVSPEGIQCTVIP
jgi:(4S)-4-hydroxy-5-phosphonooxypentane-2,3-dione isomerase